MRLAGCSTSRLGVFTFLLLLFTLVAGVDLLRRVFAVRRVQPEPLLRLQIAEQLFDWGGGNQGRAAKEKAEG